MYACGLPAWFWNLALVVASIVLLAGGALMVVSVWLEIRRRLYLTWKKGDWR